MGARDGYQRIVIWLPNQGFVCDIGGREGLAAQTPQVSEDVFRAGDGTARPKMRTHRFDVRAVKDAQLAILREMAETLCTARMAALGLGSAHQLWYEPTRLHVADGRGGARQFAGARVQMQTRMFDAAIWQGDNLLIGVPWHCTSAVDDGTGTYFLEHPTMPGYAGPEWEGSSGDGVTCAGVATISSELTLTFELPAGGATVKLTGCTGTLEAQDWDGTALDSAANGVELELPERTWQLQITVTAASQQPAVEIVKTGQALDVRRGAFDTSCATRASSVPWNDALAPSIQSILYLDNTRTTIYSLDRDGSNKAAAFTFSGAPSNPSGAFWYDDASGTLYFAGQDNAIYTTTDDSTFNKIVNDPGHSWDALVIGDGDLWAKGNGELWQIDLAASAPITPSSVATGLDSGFGGPIRYDPNENAVFYKKGSLGSATIRKWDIDGSSESTVHSRSHINDAIYLDVDAQQIYYIENQNGFGFEDIERVDYGGSGQTVWVNTENSTGAALIVDVENSLAYWFSGSASNLFKDGPGFGTREALQGDAYRFGGLQFATTDF